MQSLHSFVHKRVFLFTTLLIPLLAALLGSIGGTPQTADAWSAVPGILPGSNEKAFWPDAAVDSTGMVHVVWHDQDYQGTGTPVWYVRGQINATASGIDWQAAIPISSQSGLRSWDGSARIFVDATDKVHMTFIATDNRLYYFYSTDRGGSWAAESIDLYERSWNPGLGADANGTPYLTWANGVGNGESEAWYTYRVGQNQWAGPVNISGSCYLVRNNSLAVTTLNNQTYVHIMYDYIPKQDDKSRVYYSRGQPTSFSPPMDFSGTYLGVSQADNAAVAADVTVPGRIYAGFVHGSVDAGYKLYYSTSADNGVTWPGFAGLSVGGNIWPGKTVLAGYNGVGHIATEEKYWDGNGFSTVRIWYRSYDTSTGTYPKTEMISGNDKGTAPSIDGNGPGKFAVWVRNNDDNILFNFEALEGGEPVPTATPTTPPTNTPVPGTPTPTATPTPPPDLPVGRIQVENGAALIKLAQTFVTFILDSGNADQYKLWNEGNTEPDFQSIPSGTIEGPGGTYVVNDWTVFTSTDTESFPCQNVTVNGQFRNSTSGKSSSKMSTFVVVDPGVDADVSVVNPGPGAVRYTSQMAYRLDIQARSGECSKLTGIRVGEETVTQTLLSNIDFKPALASLMPLVPGPTADHTIVVEVTDGVGHMQQYERVITVDTEAPQLSADLALLTAPASAETNLVDLNFNNIAVTDDMYGTKTGEERPFWGVMLANSREEIDVSDSASLNALNWQAVEIKEATEETGANTLYNFTVADWNLFTGLASSQQNSGDYYIYARIMDGAGNVSTTSLKSNTVNLPASFVTPTPTTVSTPTAVPSNQNQLYLPLVVR